MARMSPRTGAFVGPYISVGSDCLLYIAPWSGNLKDHSSYGNDGVASGDTSFISDGLKFGGTNGIVTCGTSGILTATAYEIEIILKTAVGVSTYFLGLWTMNDAMGGGGECIFPNPPGPGGGLDISYLGRIASPSWTHFETVKDGAHGWEPIEDTWFHFIVAIPGLAQEDFLNAEIRFNDNPVTISHMVSGAAHAAIQKFIIGKAFYADAPFMGTVGEIRIYNAIRSASARTTSFNATKSRYGL